MSNHVPLNWQMAANVVCAVAAIDCVAYAGAYLLIRLVNAFDKWREGND